MADVGSDWATAAVWSVNCGVSFAASSEPGFNFTP